MTLRKLLSLCTILLLGLLAGCSGGGEEATGEADPGTETAAAFTVDPATAATITGKVTFTGTAPRGRPIRMDAEAVCAQAHGGPVPPENFVQNEDGTLRNAFVYIKSDFGGAKFPVPQEAVEINQKDCVYAPHVVGVMAGQTIRFLNSDTVTHNIHPTPANFPESNNSQPPQGAAIEVTFPREEIMVPVKCNVHPWMRVYVGVLRHPYFAVTGSDGTFTISNLPPGDYTLAVWYEHKDLGEQEIQVTVGDSETKEVTVEYAGG